VEVIEKVIKLPAGGNFASINTIKYLTKILKFCDHIVTIISTK